MGSTAKGSLGRETQHPSARGGGASHFLFTGTQLAPAAQKREVPETRVRFSPLCRRFTQDIPPAQALRLPQHPLFTKGVPDPGEGTQRGEAHVLGYRRVAMPLLGRQAPTCPQGMKAPHPGPAPTGREGSRHGVGGGLRAESGWPWRNPEREKQEAGTREGAVTRPGTPGYQGRQISRACPPPRPTAWQTSLTHLLPPAAVPQCPPSFSAQAPWAHTRRVEPTSEAERQL